MNERIISTIFDEQNVFSPIPVAAAQIFCYRTHICDHAKTICLLFIRLLTLSVTEKERKREKTKFFFV